MRYNPHSASAILRAHTDWVEVLAYCYKQGADSDGAPAAKAAEAEMTLLSAGADCLVRRWRDLLRGQPRDPLRDHPRDRAAVSPRRIPRRVLGAGGSQRRA